MIAQCPTCKSKLRVDDAKITASVVQVRCGTCRQLFAIRPPKEPTNAPSAAQISMSAGAPALQSHAPAPPPQLSGGEDLSSPNHVFDDKTAVNEALGGRVREGLAPELSNIRLDVPAPESDDGDSIGLDVPAAPPGTMAGDFDPLDAGNFEDLGIGGDDEAGVASARVDGEDEVVDLASIPALADAQAEVRPASLAPLERMQRAQSTASQKIKPTKRDDGLNLAISTLATGVLLLGLFYFAGGRSPTSLLSGDREAAMLGRTEADGQGFKGVRILWMRSVLYPAKDGSTMLVMVGEVENRASEPRENIDAVAEVREDGKVVATDRAPVGVALGPENLWHIVNGDALGDAYDTVIEGRDLSIAPGAKVPYSVVILNPPRRLRDLEHVVRLADGKRFTVPPPPQSPSPEPSSAVEQSDAGAAGSDAPRETGKKRRRQKKRKSQNRK